MKKDKDIFQIFKKKNQGTSLKYFKRMLRRNGLLKPGSRISWHYDITAK